MIFVIITSTSKGKNMCAGDREMECNEEKCNIINKKTIKDSRSQQIIFGPIKYVVLYKEKYKKINELNE